MARRRVEIKKIEDRSKRQITFTKRRQGLFKKAGELCTKCNAQVAVIAFSMAGNAYAFGDPSVQSVVNRYLNSAASSSKIEPFSDQDLARFKAEKKVGEILDKAIDKKGGSRRLWDAEIENLDFNELEQLKITMEEMKKKLANQENQIPESNSADQQQ